MVEEGNYNKILKRLSESSGIDEEEINKRVDAKRAKLSGLISREGALQVIAAELGVSFDNEKLKIDELLTGMRKVNFSGKVIKIFPIRKFVTKDGGEGKVVNIVVADETSNIKIVLWDTNHIDLLERGEIKEGSSVEIISGNMRQGEVHMGSFSELKLSNEKFLKVIEDKSFKEKDIAEFKVGEKIKVRAFIVQSFEIKFFNANTETGKKATEEEIQKGSPVEKRAILNIIIDDGTENIRAVLFNDLVQKIGINSFEDTEFLNSQRENILGKEFFITGDVRLNSYFNNSELIVESLEEVDSDKLIALLEKN